MTPTRRLLVLGSLVAALSPAAAQAQMSLGLRVGLAPALGEAEKGAEMSDAVRFQIPVQFDALFAITGAPVAVGPYFAYGIGKPGSFRGICDLDVVDCSARVMRFGVQGFYTFEDAKLPLVPWAGLGIGYELGSVEAASPAGKATFGYRGFELLNVQLGGDYVAGERFRIGPYVLFSLVRYSRAKSDNDIDPSQSFNAEIREKALHQWLGFGVRGRFDLPYRPLPPPSSAD